VASLLMALANWLNRQQQAAIEYLREENRVLREKRGVEDAKSLVAARHHDCGGNIP
jgi:hypothetical protein